MLLLIFILPPVITAAEVEEILVKESAAVGHADIDPTQQLIVDLTGYMLPTDASILVLQIETNYYFHQIKQNKTTYLFSKDSGKQTKGSAQFSGLSRLDSAFILLGREAYPGSLDIGVMVNYESILLRIGM
jgi:hypothetical protein